ncbi:MAG TPA: photosystem II S4 domain protein [Firmicutes bacterium]|nr:photosystem II S4 domain protein [Bacillota bacterium]
MPEIDRERLLKGLHGEERLLGALLLDKAAETLDKGRPAATDFLDPAGRALADDLLKYIEGLRVMAFGGHRRLERVRLVLLPHYYLEATVEPPVTAVEIRGHFSGRITHRDVLGALTGSGFRREKIGDILIDGDTCQVVLAPEIAAAVQRDLVKIGDQVAEVCEIDLEQLAIPPEKVKEIRSTVASMRLDSIAGLGFGESRTKMQREIKAGKVKVNWRAVLSPDYDVNPGDVIAIRGRGRVILEETTGISKKGRTGVLLKRLI